MSIFSMKLTEKGQYKAAEQLRAAIEASMGPALKKAGLKVVAVEMAATPVVTGNLRRGWIIGEPEWEGDKLILKVGNAVVYAKRVNATSRRSAGFVEKAWKDSQADAVKLVREGLQALKGQLWEKTK